MLQLLEGLSSLPRSSERIAKKPRVEFAPLPEEYETQKTRLQQVSLDDIPKKMKPFLDDFASEHKSTSKFARMLRAIVDGTCR